MLHINNIMSEQGITPIHFKGFILSYLLFGKKNIRDVGDVDMFVDGEHFDNAYMVLRNNGYCVVPGFSQDEEHHIALVKGSVYLELHKSIVKPEAGINSDYLVGHTRMLNISGNNKQYGKCSHIVNICLTVHWNIIRFVSALPLLKTYKKL